MRCSRRGFEIVTSVSGLPVTDEKISPSPYESRHSSPSTATARGAGGTLRSRRVLDRSAGLVQIQESRSTPRPVPAGEV